MGGTGVLKFCGRYKLQLIVSRRNPEITKSEARSPSDYDWGFTIAVYLQFRLRGDTLEMHCGEITMVLSFVFHSQKSHK
jgi:hypothetical protein